MPAPTSRVPINQPQQSNGTLRGILSDIKKLTESAPESLPPVPLVRAPPHHPSAAAPRPPLSIHPSPSSTPPLPAFLQSIFSPPHILGPALSPLSSPRSPLHHADTPRDVHTTHPDADEHNILLPPLSTLNSAAAFGGLNRASFLESPCWSPFFDLGALRALPRPPSFPLLVNSLEEPFVVLKPRMSNHRLSGFQCFYASQAFCNLVQYTMVHEFVCVALTDKSLRVS